MEPFLKKFQITGLFGSIHIDIDFKDNVKIIVGENGCGKTTILNMINYTLSESNTEFLKLKYYDFQGIRVDFYDDVSVAFTKKDVISWENTHIPIMIRRLYRFLSAEDVEKLIKDVQADKNLEEAEGVLRRYDISLKRFQDYVMGITEQEHMKTSMEAVRKVITSHVPGKLLYLPTFRRVEDDLKSLDVGNSYIQRLSADIGINFGMRDVENLLARTASRIQESYRNGFSRMFCEMLFDFEKNNEMKTLEPIDPKTVLAVIERMDGRFIEEEQKKGIKKHLLAYCEQGCENQEYNYFLNKLLFVFENQRKTEENLHGFADKCNDYLFNKKIIVEPDTLACAVYENDGAGREIPWDKLSSGEKQMISVFAKLYLDEENDYIVLFDEPEISLSIEWQRSYLEDIYKMERCRFLLAVTHSPFIFENELDVYAASLTSYTERI